MLEKTKIIKVDPENPEAEQIETAAQILDNGGVIAFPTETVYGLAAAVNNSKAVERLHQLKQRPEEKNFSICIHSVSQVEKFCDNITPFAYRLMKKFWPGPLTLILKADSSRTVGFRMPDHPVAIMLLKKTASPVFAPSANPAGREPAVCAEDVLKYFDSMIDAVIDSGSAKIGTASTVCEVDESGYRIIRQGAVTEEMIREVSKLKSILIVCTGNSCRSPMAEGIMKKMLAADKYISVSSAGVAAFDGMPASSEAVAILRRQRIDISAHRSRRITEGMIKESDLILVMENMHKQYIVEHITSSQDRVFLLREFEDGPRRNMDIPDPIGADMETYERVFNMLKSAVEKVVLKL